MYQMKKGGSSKSMKKYEGGGGIGKKSSTSSTSNMSNSLSNKEKLDNLNKTSPTYTIDSSGAKIKKMAKGGSIKGKAPKTPAQKKFAALAPPKNKITFADRIAGAKKGSSKKK